MPEKNEALLKEIRDNFSYYSAQWQAIHEEGRADMRVVAGDPWPEKERAARVAGDRLCLSLDEVSQYLNQSINGVRQNKRAIKVVPEGQGATEDTADARADIIRGIEYKCKAPMAYLQALSDAMQRGFGYVKMLTDYEDPESPNMVLKISAVPNPETILIDPDAKEVDFSDMRGAFEMDTMSERDFQEKWPAAEIRSFTPDHMTSAPGWIQQGQTGNYRVQVAKYWKVKGDIRKLVFLANGEKVYLDEIPGATFKPNPGKKGGLVELPSGERFTAIDQRKTRSDEVWVYNTNGLEILEGERWAGTRIPIFPCMGKTLWVPDGTGSKRVLVSLVRFAREPALLYCYARTAQAEMVGQAPKNLLIGYEGQFATKTPWDTINKVMLPYAEVKAQTTATGENILPIPQRNNYEPPIIAAGQLAQDARLAIQSAMGITGLISGQRGQDQAAKSGIALRELDQQEAEGTYHFVENYERMIEAVGREADAMLGEIYDMPRDVIAMGKDDKASVMTINMEAQDPASGEPQTFSVKSGKHGVTIATGPTHQSQHAEAIEFASVLAGNQQLIVAALSGNAPAAQLLALTIKLRELGPLGDQMADILSPPKEKEGEQKISPQQMQQVMQQLEQAQAIAIELQEKLDSQQLKLDNDLKLKEMDITVKREEIASDERIAFAKIGHDAAAKELETDTKRIEGQQDREQTDRQAAGDRAHEAGQAERSMAHESGEADAARRHEEDLSERSMEHESEESAEARKAEQKAAKAKGAAK